MIINASRDYIPLINSRSMIVCAGLLSTNVSEQVGNIAQHLHVLRQELKTLCCALVLVTSVDVQYTRSTNVLFVK